MTTPGSDLPPSPLSGLMATPMSRALVMAIVIMTLAIAFLSGMIVARLVSPASGGAPAGDVRSGELARIEVQLPSGASVLREDVNGDRFTVIYQTAAGNREVIVLPAPRRPSRVVYLIGATEADGDSE